MKGTNTDSPPLRRSHRLCILSACLASGCRLSCRCRQPTASTTACRTRPVGTEVHTVHISHPADRDRSANGLTFYWVVSKHKLLSGEAILADENGVNLWTVGPRTQPRCESLRGTTRPHSCWDVDLRAGSLPSARPKKELRPAWALWASHTPRPFVKV